MTGIELNKTNFDKYNNAIHNLLKGLPDYNSPTYATPIETINGTFILLQPSKLSWQQATNQLGLKWVTIDKKIIKVTPMI